MTSNIALPSLTSWARSHITTLLQATTPGEFDSAFDAFFAADIEQIMMNGEHITRDQYKQRLQRAKAFEQGAEVTFLGTVEAKSEKEGEKEGTVGVLLKSSVADKFKVLGAPENYTLTMTLNLLIIQDHTIQPPSTSIPIHRSFDPRRVKAFSTILASVQDPITLPETAGNAN
ncbi:hypothetical protein BDW22DRAFT_687130 [Trametopsis cervina]|nr:hypothetical protein BDW22DRAFT_687130 [Trametopsis cervina]